MTSALSISAIMPTADRRGFVPAAIAAFLAQTREDAELVILDDGAQSAADLVPQHPRIRYIREEHRRSVGAKRNRLCALATGDIIVHWDDDDWHAPTRLARQAEVLAASGAEICGLGHVAFLSADGSGAWDYIYGGGEAWVYGASLAYRRSHWSARPFPELACGEDTQWIMRAPRGSVAVLADAPESLLVARVHPGNTSAKRTGGSWWTPRDPAPLLALTKARAPAVAQVGALSDNTRPAAAPAPDPATAVRPLANVHALLVHERPDCVIDVVRNLRHLDPASPILLYDGSASGELIDKRLPWARWGVELVANPRPMHWGTLHGFALDCIAHLGSREYDTLTIVDSDQIMLRAGYPQFLARHLAGPIGVLSPDPSQQGPGTRIPPADTAQKERALWLPFLQRFAGGEDKFVHWTFWPGTVIGAEAARDIARLFGDAQLQDILSRSKLWATEEILFPTLAALLGHPVTANPCAQDWVKYRRTWSRGDMGRALQSDSAFFVHPVPRVLADPLRSQVREAHDGYRPADAERPAPPGIAGQFWPIIAAMRPVAGWLGDEEAELLLLAARASLARPGAAGLVAEVGAFCGKATLGLAIVAREARARVVAIDRFDGIVGARDGKLEQMGPTRERFDRLVSAHGLTACVETFAGEAADIGWDRPLDLVLIDGLHDYASVASDFAAFDASLAIGARAVFHDHADYFPGVVGFVAELLGSGEWQEEARAGSLVVLVRVRTGNGE